MYRIPLSQVVNIHQSLVPLSQDENFKINYSLGFYIIQNLRTLEPYVIEYGEKHNEYLNTYGEKVGDTGEFRISPDHEEEFSRLTSELKNRMIEVELMTFTVEEAFDFVADLRTIERLSVIDDDELSKYRVE